MTADRPDPAPVPPRRAALYVLATVVLVAAAAWLAWNTRQTDDGARVAVAKKLQLLNELTARGDLAVAGASTALSFSASSARLCTRRCASRRRTAWST